MALFLHKTKESNHLNYLKKVIKNNTEYVDSNIAFKTVQNNQDVTLLNNYNNSNCYYLKCNGGEYVKEFTENITLNKSNDLSNYTFLFATYPDKLLQFLSLYLSAYGLTSKKGILLYYVILTAGLSSVPIYTASNGEIQTINYDYIIPEEIVHYVLTDTIPENIEDYLYFDLSIHSTFTGISLDSDESLTRVKPITEDFIHSLHEKLLNYKYINYIQSKYSTYYILTLKEFLYNNHTITAKEKNLLIPKLYYSKQNPSDDDLYEISTITPRNNLFINLGTSYQDKEEGYLSYLITGQPANSVALNSQQLKDLQGNFIDTSQYLGNNSQLDISINIADYMDNFYNYQDSSMGYRNLLLVCDLIANPSGLTINAYYTKTINGQSTEYQFVTNYYLDYGGIIDYCVLGKIEDLSNITSIRLSLSQASVIHYLEFWENEMYVGETSISGSGTSHYFYDIPRGKGIENAGSWSVTCLTFDDKITMADGSTKLMKDLNKKDKILCPDGKIDTVIFVDAYKNKTQSKYTEYYFENYKIKIVKDHRLYCIEDKCYKKISQFKLGEHTLDTNNNIIALTKKIDVYKKINHCTLWTKNYNAYYINNILCGNRFANIKNKFIRKLTIFGFKILLALKIMR